jgi:CRISPR/Cas system-associated exonuclease Cas4 (RecB family)
MGYQVIKASEIGEYVYCHRAWWLRRNYDVRPQNTQELQTGTAYHREHGGQVRQAAVGRRVALVFLFLALSVLVFWLLSEFV